MVSLSLHLKFIRSQLEFRVGSILTFISYILFGLQIQRESLLKRFSRKMRSHVYLYITSLILMIIRSLMFAVSLNLWPIANYFKLLVGFIPTELFQ